MKIGKFYKVGKIWSNQKFGYFTNEVIQKDFIVPANALYLELSVWSKKNGNRKKCKIVEIGGKFSIACNHSEETEIPQELYNETKKIIKKGYSIIYLEVKWG